MEKCLLCDLDLKSKCPECTECTNKCDQGFIDGQNHVFTESHKPREPICCLAHGTCGCVFHFHCITVYLKTNQKCPIHDTEWWYSKYS